MVGENTHLSRLGGQVDLDDILGLVDGLQCWVRQLAFALVLRHPQLLLALALPPLLRHC